MIMEGIRKEVDSGWTEVEGQQAVPLSASENKLYIAN